jgi:hypothetical protein
MGRNTVIQLIDDIDGSEAHRTVDFDDDGKRYSLDLNEQNAAELRRGSRSLHRRRREGGRRVRPS